jgi:hypothetical protein
MADYRHFTLSDTRSSADYTTPSSVGGEQESPPRPERKSHGDKLLADLDRAEKIAKSRQKDEPIREGLQFIPMRFREGSDFELYLKGIAGNESQGIRIVSVREKAGQNEYLVAVPDSKVQKLANKFRAYRDEDTGKGKPKNEPLASSISKIDAAELVDYWTAPDESLPSEDEALWWEVWLASSPGDDVETWFRETASRQNITVSSERVRFPDRVVILAYTTLSHWRQFPGLLRHLAEFRRANIVAGEFTRLNPAGQAEYIEHLLARTTIAPEQAVRVCILDTGVDRGHPLLEHSLSPVDLQSWRTEWGGDDHHGHGTQLAGVCLFGPLSEPLYDDQAVSLGHRLESVKILPPKGSNNPPDYGPITLGAMALAETTAPSSQRVFCIAVTAEGDDHWRPTLWSAALDQSAAGTLDGSQRLLLVSAGNLREEVGKNYPVENHVSSVEDPAQSWNALTVGAYTDLAWVAEKGLEGYTPIAKPGTLSPASRTSMCWDENWPYKPDVVFEGGNYAKDGKGFITSAEDLEVLTTFSEDKSNALLGTIRDTSAATAQAARMAAILQSEYPDYWPETIRGLMVHSAEWTPQMLEEFPRKERKSRLRVYGMGVPNLARARRSAKGFATMVIQDQLQPYKRTGGENSTNEMHVHELPLPKEVLEDLGSTMVRMRVTLSYFVEPNPPRRGYVARYQYASHGLRFSVRRPQETRERMIARLSTSDWPKDATTKKKKRPFKSISDDRTWDLGPERIAVRGSVHSDAWTGTAAQLASSNLIAIYPVGGWWRYRRDPELVEKAARYSLIVSITTDDSSVDLYAQIESQIQAQVTARSEIATEISGS